jgi:hypothetical protein
MPHLSAAPLASFVLATQVGEDFRRMTPRADRFVGFQNVALFVDQITDAFGKAGFSIVTRAVGKANRAVSIAQQYEGETILLSEGGILCHRIKADTEHFDISRLEFADLIAEPATFRCSSRCVGFGIKPQQHFLACEAGERKCVAFMGEYGELWCCRTNR